ncbi:MAG: tRNA preQ1(34) S-adenosylmethionine ribosyltransferase-isomerase QueA [Planctomycetales bacterium]|nr:tRNA preQ1(34) S-adenosylmethionine ribosyltransferase-isomerase QueA [Planctomycetales bacterium]
MTDISAYDFDLPPDLIAQHPLPNRADARLMIVDRRQQTIDHAHVRDLADYIEDTDCVVLNDTRVIPARLDGYRQETGGHWSGLFVSADEHGIWEVLSKTRGKLRAGEAVVLRDRRSVDRLQLKMLANLGGGVWAAKPSRTESHLDLLSEVGRVPLPPYIRGGQMEADDIDRYQTVYAESPGAVAAPTAGLHLTHRLLQSLEAKGTDICHLTLHVGIGTFRPIAAEAIEEHTMHKEWGELTAETAERLNRCRQERGRIVAVGTTSVRVLETAVRPDGILAAWSGDTDIFIRPPYRFRAVDALLTNFHLPKSTLLILVRCFGGDELMRLAYEIAREERYRFYSYGDAMLIV